MRRIWIAGAIATLFAVAACGKSGGVFGKLEKLVDELCDCEDAKCAEKVTAEINELGKELQGMDKSKISEKDMERSMKAAQKMAECQQKLAGSNSFDDYKSKSKTTEARMFVKKMYDGARAYYLDAGYSRESIQPVAPQFPAPSAGPVPPLGTCCDSGGKCEPKPEYWNEPTWIALQFSVDDPHYYSYQYVVDNSKKTFEVMAFGDLDCDGEYSTFKMSGVVNETYADGPAGTSALVREKELE